MMQHRYFLTMNEQDGSNRTKTSESCDYTIPSNLETPTSGHSTSSRPIGRDKAKRKGKGKIEREKLDKPSMKMYQKMLIKLLEKEHLSPEDQDIKRKLTEILFGK
ncbi:hypothetical protein SASPL_123597 [Salvia splendens]|uniref:Uncharacterized protein n=1 Tax=Salvia splendens TaxID=180675 RepID=A0A8X8ZTC1_SALSN|nr:hypothetical protein SASPL_123597 [Salvia splendens]